MKRSVVVVMLLLQCTTLMSADHSSLLEAGKARCVALQQKVARVITRQNAELLLAAGSVACAYEVADVSPFLVTVLASYPISNGINEVFHVCKTVSGKAIWSVAMGAWFLMMSTHCGLVETTDGAMETSISLNMMAARTLFNAGSTALEACAARYNQPIQKRD